MACVVECTLSKTSLQQEGRDQLRFYSTSYSPLERTHQDWNFVRWKIEYFEINFCWNKSWSRLLWDVIYSVMHWHEMITSVWKWSSRSFALFMAQESIDFWQFTRRDCWSTLLLCTQGTGAAVHIGRTATCTLSRILAPVMSYRLHCQNCNRTTRC